ncbi:hydroxyethylthiazole kinase [Vreelandella aquamarina]
MTLPTPGQHLATLRQHTPLTHCMTNYVAMNSSANVLLAIGASPAMLHEQEEVAEFVRLSAALSINIGTISTPWAHSMRLAARTAHEGITPWVLDPVAVGATAYRQALCTDLLALKPSAIRGNASEILSLNGIANPGRGADSTASAEEAHAAACQLARQQHCIVAVSGETDIVTDGHQSVRIHGGHALMPRVTTLGCALSATVAAFIGVTPSAPLTATAAALGCFALAGQQAGCSASGPGSFMPAFLDALYQLSPEDLDTQIAQEVLDAV